MNFLIIIKIDWFIYKIKTGEKKEYYYFLTMIFHVIRKIFTTKFYYLSFITCGIYFLILKNRENKKEDKVFESNTKYVVYECTSNRICGGWDGRLKGIMSSYAWSLITNRKFLIRHEKPCLLTNMLEPNEINWNIKSKNFTKIQKSNSIAFDYIDSVKFKASLTNYTEFDTDEIFIVFKNNLDWLEPLSKNKIVIDRLKFLNIDPNEFKLPIIFQKWYNKLFKLNKKLDFLYKKFLSKINTNKNGKIICAELKISNKRDSFTDKKNTIKYWDLIRKNFVKDDQNYKLFLITDAKKIEIEAIKYFGKNKVVTNEGLNVHLERENTCKNTDKTFLDFHSLQKCDMAIFSENGFAKLGLLNRDEPSSYLVMFSKKQKFIIINNTVELEIL